MYTTQYDNIRCTRNHRQYFTCKSLLKNEGSSDAHKKERRRVTKLQRSGMQRQDAILYGGKPLVSSVLHPSGMTVARIYSLKDNTRERVNSERRREMGRERKERKKRRKRTFRKLGQGKTRTLIEEPTWTKNRRGMKDQTKRHQPC